MSWFYPKISIELCSFTDKKDYSKFSVIQYRPGSLLHFRLVPWACPSGKNIYGAPAAWHHSQVTCQTDYWLHHNQTMSKWPHRSNRDTWQWGSFSVDFSPPPESNLVQMSNPCELQYKIGGSCTSTHWTTHLFLCMFAIFISSTNLFFNHFAFFREN